MGSWEHFPEFGVLLNEGAYFLSPRIQLRKHWAPEEKVFMWAIFHRM